MTWSQFCAVCTFHYVPCHLSCAVYNVQSVGGRQHYTVCIVHAVLRRPLCAVYTVGRCQYWTVWVCHSVPCHLSCVVCTVSSVECSQSCAVCTMRTGLQWLSHSFCSIELHNCSRKYDHFSLYQQHINVRQMKWSWTEHINRLKDDKWTSHVTTCRPHDKKVEKGDQPRGGETTWTNTSWIWQRTA